MVRKNLDLAILTILLDPEGKSVVLDVTSSKGYIFKLVAVCSPTIAGRLDFFRRQVTFLGTLHLLVLVGDWNRMVLCGFSK